MAMLGQPLSYYPTDPQTGDAIDPEYLQRLNAMRMSAPAGLGNVPAASATPPPQASAPAPQPPSFNQRIQNGLGALFPVDPNSGIDPAYAQQLKNNAILKLGLGMVAAGRQPGATLGSALAAGLGGASNDLEGAMQTAYRNALLAKQEKRQSDAEQRAISNDQWTRQHALDTAAAQADQFNRELQLKKDELAHKDEISPFQKAQIDIERQKLKLQQDAANPFGMAGATGAGASALSGDAYLQALNPTTAAQVKALAEGRMQFPGGFALKSPYWQQMISAVSQYDPSFDAVNYNSRAKTRSDFTSGKNAQNIKALNTAIGHLGTLNDQIAGTASSSFTPWNYVANTASTLTGDAGPTQFKQTAGALASELTQVFRGSGGAEADVKRYLEELDSNASQSQKQAAVRNIVDLLNSRLSAIGDQYNQGMGTTADPLTLLNPKAVSVLQKIRDQESAKPKVGLGQTPYAFAPANPAADAAIAKRASSYY